MPPGGGGGAGGAPLPGGGGGGAGGTPLLGMGGGRGIVDPPSIEGGDSSYSSSDQSTFFLSILRMFPWILMSGTPLASPLLLDSLSSSSSTPLQSSSSSTSSSSSHSHSSSSPQSSSSPASEIGMKIQLNIYCMFKQCFSPTF